MFILRKHYMMNAAIAFKILVKDECLEFIYENDRMILPFETHQEAQIAYNNIIDGLKRKDAILYL
jgi:hypothetical protein